MDSCSSARVRTLVVPIGKIKRSRFYNLLKLLTPVCEIRLGDVTPDPRPDRGVFSPLAFPDGYVLYEFLTSAPSDVHISLSPFELFREPLAVIGLVDAREYAAFKSGKPDDQVQTANLRDLVGSAITKMEDDYPRVLVRKILVFDYNTTYGKTGLHEDAISVPSVNQLKATTMRTLMCDITSNLLAEMTTLSASIKALPSMASPSNVRIGTGGASYAQHGDKSPVLSRANSQFGDSTRSDSANSNNHHRMSMPVFPSSNSTLDGTSGDSRPSSPMTGSQSPPAKTFEEIVNGGGPATTASRVTPVNSRDNSRDRVSISGFGPGSIDERNRNKGKCRVSIVISSLYILAGRWNDALRELADSAARARSYSDHIWYAKALENMVTCMVMLAWSGTSFKIPPICYPVLERTSSKLAQVTSAAELSNGSAAANRAAVRAELAGILPDMTSMILSVYTRAANSGAEYLPQIAYSECVIRLSKVLSGIHLGDGTLNDAALGYIVRGIAPEALSSVAMHTRLTIVPSRARITDMLMRAMPGSSENSGLSAMDEASILAGVASVLSSLHLQRKKAMILKEYIQALIRVLEEAKRTGAAEAGIHPSSNGFAQNFSAIPGTHGGTEGLEDFLNLLCQVYGIPESNWSSTVGSETLHASQPNSSGENKGTTAPLPEQLIGNFVLRFFGSVNVKSDVLRICIRLCEALPDPRGVLHWTSALLRTAGPGVAPSADSSDVLVTLSREEQLHLASTVAKTVSDAQAVGLKGIEAEYWDEFLVRGVFLVPSSNSLVLHSHKKSDLLTTVNKKVAKKGPFIHNPFLDKTGVKDLGNLFVARDEREFVVSLQNPYDFEVHIEFISFTAGERSLGRTENLVLRSYRTQSFSVTGSLGFAGKHNLEKCVIKIRGCKERAFPIFGESWSPERDTKIKFIGLLKAPSSEVQSESDLSTLSAQSANRSFPKPTILSLTIIPPQAILEIVSVSLPQASIMLLEGESTVFRVTIKNTSKSIAADFFHVSYLDSTTAAVQEALLNKKLSSSELFELEYQLTQNQAVRMASEKPAAIEPGHCCELEFEVLGKPGLTGATIHIDYANLSTQHTENEDLFYTRQVSLPIAITVNSSVQLHRLEVLPVSEDFVNHRHLNPENVGDGHCLLLLDLRNAWPVPLEITLDILESKLSQSQGAFDKPCFNTHEIIQPGHVSRMILLLPKIHIKNPHARIRSANERQFVVSANNMSPDTERAARELFWYREALLKSLRATWKQENGTKHGTVDLRSIIRLTPRMVDALKLDDVEIRMHIGDDAPHSSDYQISVDEQVAFTTRITNRSETTIYPLLRLRPSLSHQPPDVALDIGKRFAWSGLLQRILSPIQPGEFVEATLAICALCAGKYEFGATVEEVKPCSGGEEKKGNDAIPDPVAATMGRRSWIAGKPCRIIAID